MTIHSHCPLASILTPSSYPRSCNHPPLPPSIPRAVSNFYPDCAGKLLHLLHWEEPPFVSALLDQVLVLCGLLIRMTFLASSDHMTECLASERFEHPGEDIVSFPGLPSFPMIVLWAGGSSWSLSCWWTGCRMYILHRLDDFVPFLFHCTNQCSEDLVMTPLIPPMAENTLVPSQYVRHRSLFNAWPSPRVFSHQCRLVCVGSISYNKRSRHEMQKGCHSPESRPGDVAFWQVSFHAGSLWQEHHGPRSSRLFLRLSKPFLVSCPSSVTG